MLSALASRELIRRIINSEALAESHILFINSSERGRVREILETVKNRPILTIGDLEEFTGIGGMIRFFKVGGKILFRINAEAAKLAGININPQLMALGK